MNDKETSEIVVEPVKKKRERKPKVKDNKIKAKISKNFNSKNVLQNINTSNIDNPCILHLNVTNIENDTMNNDISRLDSHSFETAFCEYNPDISEPNAYENTHTNFMLLHKTTNRNEETHENNPITNVMKHLDNNEKWAHTSSDACHWCCHSFSNTPMGIPIKYLNNLFYCCGSFCSLECATAYNFECNQMNINVWESYNLINLLSKILDYKKSVKCAPRKQTLKMFGGNMDIEEFRKLSNNNTILTCNTYPMISITDNVEEINDFLYINNDLNDSFSIKLDNVSTSSFACSDNNNTKFDENIMF